MSQPPIFFSDYFGVSRKTIDRYGAFDINLLADVPLFVDPFLLFNSSSPSINLQISDSDAIVLVDARRDNKPSGSRA